MNSLIESGCITEMLCGSNCSYVLNDNRIFLPTEYKVLQSQSGYFVKCMKMHFNGKIQLYYVTQTLKSFFSMMDYVELEKFLMITVNLLGNIIDVKHNGFLSCQNIDISFEHIYIDLSTYKVSLIYLPLSKRIHYDNVQFENELRTTFIKLISKRSSLSSPRIVQFLQDLSDGRLSLEDIYHRLKNGMNLSDAKPKSVNLRIVTLNCPECMALHINKDNYTIGKKQGAVDGVVSFNNKISRIHCRVNQRGNRYTLTDLQSANGTFLNHVRLQSNIAYPLKHGDVIRMANSDFQVIME